MGMKLKKDEREKTQRISSEAEEATIHQVNKFTGGNMDVEVVQKDDQKLNEILKPSEERLEQEREEGIDALKEADFSGREARKLADSWVQLRTEGAERKLSREETVSATKIADAHVLFVPSVGEMSKAREKARKKWVELQAEMVENGHSDKRTVRNSDIFYAMATMEEYSNPAFLKLCEKHRELRGLFERREDLAEELHEEGKSYNEVQVALNEDRRRRAREAWKDKGLRKLLIASGYNWKRIEAMIGARELSEFAAEAAIRQGDMERVERLKKNAAENADDPGKMAEGVRGIMEGADYLTKSERGRIADMVAGVIAVAAAAGALGALGEEAGETGASAPDAEVSYYFDEVMQNELLAQDETQNLASMNEAIEDLIEEDKKRGESSEEEPTVADLNEETQDALEKFGVSTEATVKEALEVMENARKDMDRVGRLSTPEYFVKDEGGNLVLTEDDREGVQYTKRPEFTPAEEAVKLIGYDRKVIEEHAPEFFLLSAHEFAPSEDKMGTAKIVSEKYDFSQADSPESIVLNALLNPADKEAREEAMKVLENPANAGVRAALLEAVRRAKARIGGKKEVIVPALPPGSVEKRVISYNPA